MTMLLSDSFLLYGFQAVLLFLVGYAELKDRGWFRKPTGADATTKRGKTSWNILNFSFGIIAVNVLQIINSADAAVHFKVLMSVFDLTVMIWLFFFNGWFRNKTIGIVIKAQQQEEGKRAIPRPAAPGGQETDA
jgi:hypothetical protein